MKLYGYQNFVNIFLLVISMTVVVSGQNILTDMDPLAHQRYDRMIIMSGGGDSSLHAAIKPYWRNDLVILADTFSHYTQNSRTGYQVQRIYDQQNEFVNPEGDPFYHLLYASDSSTLFQYTPDSLAALYRLSKHPLWKTFYKTPEFFYEVDVKDFYLRVNPILHLAVGQESN